MARALPLTLPAVHLATGLDPALIIKVVDSADRVGSFPSLELDRVGLPVISYYDLTSADLKLVHCNDPDGTDFALLREGPTRVWLAPSVMCVRWATGK